MIQIDVIRRKDYNMDIISKLIKIFNDHPNQSHSSLSRLLLLNANATYKSSIYEMADKCFTSPTTISRFIKNLECTGYPQYKYFLNDALYFYNNRNRVIPKSSDDISPIHDYVLQVTEALKNFEANLDMDLVEKICFQINTADNIICIAPEIGDFPLLQYDLFLQGKTAIFPYGLTETEEYVSNLKSNSFSLVFIPPERESTRMENVLESLHSKDIGIAAYASKKYKKIQKYSDLVIQYDTTNTALDNILYNAFIDVLTISYRKKYIDAI